MAIYGIGASYDGKDVSAEFLRDGVACVGWSQTDAPTLHQMLSHVKVGDIIYIKSFPPNIGLIIKAVGVVIGNAVTEHSTLGSAVRVRWEWQGDLRVGKVDDKYPIRGITIYEEHNFDIQSQVIQLLLS